MLDGGPPDGEAVGAVEGFGTGLIVFVVGCVVGNNSPEGERLGLVLVM